MREIIDPLYGVTRNNRKIYKGKCVECDGKVALMGGYATLPDTTYTNNTIEKQAVELD